MYKKSPIRARASEAKERSEVEAPSGSVALALYGDILNRRQNRRSPTGQYYLLGNFCVFLVASHWGRANMLRHRRPAARILIPAQKGDDEE